MCSACPGRRGRDGPHPLQPATAGGPYAGPGPSRSPRPRRRHRSFHRSGGGARSRRPVSTNHGSGRLTSAGAAAVPGISCSTTRDSPAAMAARRSRRRGRPRRTRAGNSQHRRQRMPRQGAGRRAVGGDGGQRPGGRLPVQFRLLEQVGVGLAAAPRGAQLGVGGRRGGVPGQVPAVRAVRVGRGGDRRQAARTCSSVRSGRAGRPRASNGSGFTGWLRVRRRHPGWPAGPARRRGRVRGGARAPAPPGPARRAGAAG